MKNIFKKSILFLLIVLTVALPLASCGGTADTTLPETTATETEPLEVDYSGMPYTEEVGSISILGAPISEYRVVIPAEADKYTKFAAQNLVDYLKYNADITLEVVTDAEAASGRELLIGATNRPGSLAAAAVELSADEYIMMRDGDSVVLYGNSYMVGGAAGDLINRKAAGAWRGYDVDITKIANEPVPTQFTFDTARNALLLIGDGMGFEQINMTEAKGNIEKFAAKDMPYHGQSVTKSQSVIDNKAQFTDSAAGGTALSSGFKTTNGFVGLGPKLEKLYNLRELAHDTGAKTAVLSTDAITGATPAAFLAHIYDRNATSHITKQINDLKNNGAVEYAVGSLDDNNFLSASVDALQGISKHGSSFFAMIEEGYIDKRCHNNDAAGTIHMVERFDELIAYCMEFALFHPDTVIVVTADHETGGLKYFSQVSDWRYTSGDHTNVDVPIFAIGSGAEYFDGAKVENTCIAQFIAKIFGDESFGDPQYGKYE